MSLNVFPSEQFHFGPLDAKPILREGWEWREDKLGWLMVEAPTGEMFFYGKSGLTRAVKFPDGRYGADSAMRIPLPLK